MNIVDINGAIQGVYNKKNPNCMAFSGSKD
jgi:hypothetical protein